MLARYLMFTLYKSARQQNGVGLRFEGGQLIVFIALVFEDHVQVADISDSLSQDIQQM